MSTRNHVLHKFRFGETSQFNCLRITLPVASVRINIFAKRTAHILREDFSRVKEDLLLAVSCALCIHTGTFSLFDLSSGSLCKGSNACFLFLICLHLSELYILII